MPRYIDADALLEMLNDKAKTDLEMGLYNHGALTQSFIRFVERRPTADVATRAEVAREIFEEIEQEINAALQSNYKVLPQIEQSESLWNRVNGKIDALRGIDGFIAELKKKYTGE